MQRTDTGVIPAATLDRHHHFLIKALLLPFFRTDHESLLTTEGGIRITKRAEIHVGIFAVKAVNEPAVKGADLLSNGRDTRRHGHHRQNLPGVTLLAQRIPIASLFEYRAVGFIASNIGRKQHERVGQRPHLESVNATPSPATAMQVSHDLLVKPLLVRGRLCYEQPLFTGEHGMRVTKAVHEPRRVLVIEKVNIYVISSFDLMQYGSSVSHDISCDPSW
jgi:hypothetical protein